MSTPTPIFNPLRQLVQAAIMAATSRIIQAAGTAQAAQLARAQTMLGIVTALQEINAGDEKGIAAVQSGLLALWRMSDPAMQVVVNTLIATISTELEVLASNGIVARAVGALANDQLSFIADACNAYIQAYASPPAAGQS